MKAQENLEHLQMGISKLKLVKGQRNAVMAHNQKTKNLNAYNVIGYDCIIVPSSEYNNIFLLATEHSSVFF